MKTVYNYAAFSEHHKMRKVLLILIYNISYIWKFHSTKAHIEEKCPRTITYRHNENLVTKTMHYNFNLKGLSHGILSYFGHIQNYL